MKHLELIYTIFKTHRGEWLATAQVRAIVCAITGRNATRIEVRACINRLTSEAKLVESDGRWTCKCADE